VPFNANQNPCPFNPDSLLPHRACTTLPCVGLLCLCLRNTLGEDGGIIILSLVSLSKQSWWRRKITYSLILDLLGLAALQRNTVTLVLEALRSNQSLDPGSLGIWPLSLTLGLNLTSNDVLTDLLSQRKSSISLCFLHGVLSLSTRTAPFPPLQSSGRRRRDDMVVYIHRLPW